MVHKPISLHSSISKKYKKNIQIWSPIVQKYPNFEYSNTKVMLLRREMSVTANESKDSKAGRVARLARAAAGGGSLTLLPPRRRRAARVGSTTDCS